MPAVLIETAFISNPHDVALLRSPAFLQNMAQGIANGVKAYAGKPPAQTSQSRSMIGVYDSGLGGLTVLAALRAAAGSAMTSSTSPIKRTCRTVSAPMPISTDCSHEPRLAREPRRRPGRDGLQHVVRRGKPARLAGCELPSADSRSHRQRRASVRAIAVPARRRRRDAGDRAQPCLRARDRRAGAAHRGRRDRGAVLVPLVEAGESESERARAAVRDVVAEFPRGVDAIVYGCTHYPLLDAHFAAAAAETSRASIRRANKRAPWLALNLPPAAGSTHLRHQRRRREIRTQRPPLDERRNRPRRRG